jgi:lipopolysaccharide export system permease protein
LTPGSHEWYIYAVYIIDKINRKFYLYLLRELSYILLLSLAILTFILVMSRLGKLTDLVVNKGVNLKDIVLLIVYSSPPYLTFTFPMAFLLSTIVVLGRFSTENEILALKASGVNLKCLFVPIGFVGIVITVIGLLNTNLLLPTSSNRFRDTLLNVVKKGIAVDDKEGIFNDTIPGVVIYIDKVDTKSKKLYGIMVADDRDKNLKQTISASSGLINLDPDTLDLSFALHNGSLHRWEKAEDAYRTVSFRDYTFTMNLGNMLPNAGIRKKTIEMDRNEIRNAISRTTDPERRYELTLEIYKKISVPLASLCFLPLAIPLGIKRKIEGRFSGVMYSLLLFVFYYILMALTENMGKIFNIPPSLTAFIPNIAIGLFSVYLLRNLNDEGHSTASRVLKHFMVHYFEKAK